MFETRTRSRQDKVPSSWTDSTTTIPPFGTGVPTVTTGRGDLVVGQKTVDTETIWPYVVKARKLYRGTRLKFDTIDVGGNFYTARSYASENPQLELFRQHNAYTSSRWTGDGVAWSGSSGPSGWGVLPYLTVPEQQALMAKGSTAISRCIPTNPVSGLANFLGELRRDGLPSVPGLSMRDKTDRLRNSGSEYLNLEFAWRPMLADLRSFGSTVKNHDKILKQYIRDSGKGIRRGYRFDTDRTVIRDREVVSTNWRPAGVPSKYSPTGGTLTRSTVKTEDVWFSGCFCYYLALDDNLTGKLQRNVQLADKLFGVKIDPALLWNLAPWSWAADWVSNVGDVMTNVSAFLTDGLVMRWGYVMQHTTIVDTYELTAITGYTPSCNTPPLTQTFTQERKVRLKASPFGFGLNSANLSTRQKAIIAALGISQRPGRAF